VALVFWMMSMAITIHQKLSRQIREDAQPAENDRAAERLTTFRIGLCSRRRGHRRQ
jgi:hypothetical protein